MRRNINNACVDIFEDDGGGFGLKIKIRCGQVTRLRLVRMNPSNAYLRIPHNIQERNHVGTTSNVLQNLDFSLNLLLLDRLEDFDDTFRGGWQVDGFKDLIGHEWANQPRNRLQGMMRIKIELTSEYFPRPTFRTIS